MKKNFRSLLGAIILTIGFVSIARAESKPLQLALFEPVQLFSADTSITGLRINFIYGRNDTVEGVDIGLVGLAESSFTGWQYNVGNITKGDFTGLQMGFVNYAGNAEGFQLGAVNYAERLKGLQIGFINIIGQGGAFPVLPFINWSF